MNLSVLPSRIRGWWSRLIVRVRRAPAMARGEVTLAPSVGAAETVAPEPVDAPKVWSSVSVPRVRPEPDPEKRRQTLEALEKLQQIPSLHSLAQGFLRVARAEGALLDEIVTAVERDPALCVRLLRMANSVTIRPERRIEDVFSAVQLLGARRVGTLAQAMFTLRDHQDVACGLNWRHLWVHSLATAALAEELARRLNVPHTPQLYLAALLHDVGKIVLSTVAPETYRGILGAMWTAESRLDDLELAELGVTHGEAGVRFAHQAQLPEEVIAAIAHHGDPENAVEFRTDVALVALANFVVKSFGLGFSGARLTEADGDYESQPAWRVLHDEHGLTPEALPEEELRVILEMVKTEMQGLHPVA